MLSTEVLSEGVNLHRSNIVINYDIPWNPTRLMQRVGRINRVDTKFKKIFTYNFFPTVQSNTQIKLREAAEAKIHSFIEMLGADAKLIPGLFPAFIHGDGERAKVGQGIESSSYHREGGRGAACKGDTETRRVGGFGQRHLARRWGIDGHVADPRHAVP